MTATKFRVDEMYLLVVLTLNMYLLVVVSQQKAAGFDRNLPLFERCVPLARNVMCLTACEMPAGVSGFISFHIAE